MKLLTGMKSASGKRSGFMLKIVLSLLAVLLISCGGLHIYSRYAVDRALSLLSEATLIKVDDTEEPVLSLVARYGGTKRYPESTQAGSASYSYEIKLSPFQVFSNGHGAMAHLMVYVPNYLRGFLGLRNWLVLVGVRIQNGRVESVNGDAFVEGGSRWLGNSWHKLSSRVDEASSAYSIEMSSLNISRNGGSGVDESFTPVATHEQVQTSYDLNRSCFTGFIPCSTLCDFKPSLFGYLKEHPEIRGNFDTNYCRVP
jgi:hypothetical protein